MSQAARCKVPRALKVDCARPWTARTEAPCPGGRSPGDRQAPQAMCSRTCQLLGPPGPRASDPQHALLEVLLLELPKRPSRGPPHHPLLSGPPPAHDLPPTPPPVLVQDGRGRRGRCGAREQRATRGASGRLPALGRRAHQFRGHPRRAWRPGLAAGLAGARRGKGRLQPLEEGPALERHGSPGPLGPRY